MSIGIKRFYKVVDVAVAEGAFTVTLDGKPVKTPGRAALALPALALAAAVAQEWRAQGATVEPITMPLTRLCSAAIGIAGDHRARLVADVLAFGRSDLLCYRAEGPDALIMRQAKAWDPLLDWAEARFGARLATSTGIVYVAQPAVAVEAFASAVDRLDPFRLAGLHGAASLTGSLVLALALLEGRLDAVHAFALSRIDEDYQAQIWGRDAEAEARAARHESELAAIERFLAALDPKRPVPPV
jgi:chaperone required for assembly of F1-ATPase